MQGIVQNIYNHTAGQFIFTADNTLSEVSIVTSGEDDLYSGFNYFPEGCGVLIEAVSIVYPFQYSQGNIDPIKLNIAWRNKTSTQFGNLEQFGNAGELLIPEPNNFIDVNNYINYPGVPGDGSWVITGDILSGTVNQINGPAILQGLDLDIKIFLRIRTALGMVA